MGRDGLKEVRALYGRLQVVSQMAGSGGQHANSEAWQEHGRDVQREVDRRVASGKYPGLSREEIEFHVRDQVEKVEAQIESLVERLAETSWTRRLMKDVPGMRIVSPPFERALDLLVWSYPGLTRKEAADYLEERIDEKQAELRKLHLN